jgi:hypothetical protein
MWFRSNWFASNWYADQWFGGTTQTTQQGGVKRLHIPAQTRRRETEAEKLARRLAQGILQAPKTTDQSAADDYIKTLQAQVLEAQQRAKLARAEAIAAQEMRAAMQRASRAAQIAAEKRAVELAMAERVALIQASQAAAEIEAFDVAFVVATLASM